MAEPATPDYWRAIEPYWHKLNVHSDPATFLADFAQLPGAVGDLLAAHWLVSEVWNGALPQFFSNSSGVLAPESVDGLRRLGLDLAAEIVEAAMTFFDEPYPRQREVRAPMIDWVWGDDELSEDEAHNLDIMLDLSGQFLDAIGKDQQAFIAAANAYAQRHCRHQL